MNEQPALSFGSSRVPNAHARKGPVQARHASRQGAESAANRAENQTARLMALYQAYPEGLTDWQAAKLLGVERTSVNARRNPLVKTGVVVANGFAKDEHSDVPNTRWQLASMRRSSQSETHGSVGVDGDTQPRGPKDRQWSEAPDSVRAESWKPGQNRHAANQPIRLTRDTVRDVPMFTRIRLARGGYAQLRFIDRTGLLHVWVHATRRTDTMKPESLLDCRETDGELVEIAS